MPTKGQGRPDADPRIKPNGESDSGEKLLPSQLMRRLRPEYFSDTSGRTAYELDRSTFEYHLETITARNQTHDFEVFCRKLCERVICPNLRPATGPEGGGDSKADAETFAVADEVSRFYYTAEANAGSERWAFAFSAKEDWKSKVRSDVKGIAETGRGYDRIICVTSRFARSKDRSALEDGLKARFGIPVEIHDRTWIVDEIVDNNRQHLAFNYLKVGKENKDSQCLGPKDYSRTQELNEIEAALDDADRFRGMESQRVTEALIAAGLARAIELPRPEIEGRFNRAIRLASEYGTHRQQLEVNYEAIRTAFWWFDEINLLNSSYEGFEARLMPDEHVKNVEFLSEIAQLLVVAVGHGHLTLDESNLVERIGRLRERLEEIERIDDQPNSALEASTLLVLWKLSMAMVQGKTDKLTEVWPEFAAILERAKPMGEYDALGIVKLISVAGQIAGNDKDYSALVEKAAAFVGERRSEGEAARLLVERAEQLDFDQSIEMIRLLGKAVRRLTKKEYGDELIEALKLLALAYRSSGLLWAARATCLMAAERITSEALEESNLTPALIPIFNLWAWISLELRHLPDLICALQFVRGLAGGLSPSDEARESLAEEWQQMDALLAGLVLGCTDEDLENINALPTKLGLVELHFTRMALLYLLGYEQLLIEEGSLPDDQGSEEAKRLFSTLASQSDVRRIQGPLVCNLEGRQTLQTKVLGLSVRVHCSGSEHSIQVAELIAGAVEAFFATALDLNLHPHTESFDIEVVEREGLDAPQFEADEGQMCGELHWPQERSPAEFNTQADTVRTLLNTTASILGVTCFSPKLGVVIEQICGTELVTERLVMLTATPLNYHRLCGRSMSRLGDHIGADDKSFPPLERPELQETTGDSQTTRSTNGTVVSHRNIDVSSIINVHLWDSANWRGAAYPQLIARKSKLPVIALLFEERASAVRIFEGWRKRFGLHDADEALFLAIVREISPANPSHYKILVTSSLPKEAKYPEGVFTGIISRSITVNAVDTTNLDRFLRELESTGEYVLFPAILKGDSVELIEDLAIKKRHLSVRNLEEIGENDPEVMAFPSRFDAWRKQGTISN